MSFNITGLDSDVFVAVNTAVHFTLLSTLSLPAITLHVVVIIALLLTNKINWQVKTTLINISTAEIITSISGSFFYIAYPLRVRTESALSCDVALGFLFLGFFSNLNGTTIFAITMYVFIKYGPKKMKLWVLVTAITISWVVYTALGLITATMVAGGAINNNGFCMYDEISLPVVEVIGAVVSIANMFLIVTFGILTYCVRRDVSEGTADSRRALSRLLLYHSIKMSVLLGQFITTSFAPIFQPSPSSKTDIIVFLVIEYAAIEVASLMMSILSLCVLKPLRDALRLLCVKMFPCCEQNKVHPSPSAITVAEPEDIM